MALTPAEIVSLASELRELGVRRFAWGDISLEFGEASNLETDASGPADIAPTDPVTQAAHRLANRAFRAA